MPVHRSQVFLFAFVRRSGWCLSDDTESPFDHELRAPRNPQSPRRTRRSFPRSASAPASSGVWVTSVCSCPPSPRPLAAPPPTGEMHEGAQRPQCGQRGTGASQGPTVRPKGDGCAGGPRGGARAGRNPRLPAAREMSDCGKSSRVRRQVGGMWPKSRQSCPNAASNLGLRSLGLRSTTRFGFGQRRCMPAWTPQYTRAIPPWPPPPTSEGRMLLLPTSRQRQSRRPPPSNRHPCRPRRPRKTQHAPHLPAMAGRRAGFRNRTLFRVSLSLRLVLRCLHLLIVPLSRHHLCQ